jgi:kinesin family protein 15
VGAPVVDNCLSGYNSSIFAYGQTGAGKTFTMTGRLGGPGSSGGGGSGGDAGARELQGLAPRVFEYLFERIEEMQDKQVHRRGARALGD